MKLRKLSKPNYRQILRIYQRDMIYSSLTMTKFINYLMTQGQKVKVLNIFYQTIQKIRLELKYSAFSLFYEAIIANLPLLHLVKVRKGRKLFKIGVPITPRRRRILFPMRWLGQLIHKSDWQQNIISILTHELFKGTSKKSEIYVQKKRILQVARQNRVFTYLAWVNLYR